MATALAPKVKSLLNQTGSVLEQQGDYESTFAPIETWTVGKFREFATIETPFVSKKGNLICIITRPDGNQVFAGISNAAKNFIKSEGFSASKLNVSIMPATEDWPQGFLIHVPQGGGAGKVYVPEVD